MAGIGGNIKVTLTLDDSGFTVKTQGATETVQKLNTNLKGMTEGVKQGEGSLKSMAGSVDAAQAKLDSLGASAGAAATQVGALGESVGLSQKYVAQLNSMLQGSAGAVAQFAERLGLVTDNMTKANVATREMSAANEALSKSSGAVVAGMTAQERAAMNLGAASRAAAESLKLTSAMSKDTAAQAIAQEFRQNSQMVVNKKAVYNSLLDAEKQYQSQLNESRSRAMAIQMQMDQKLRQLGPYGGKNVLAALQQELDLEMAKSRQLEQSIALISKEAVSVNETVLNLTKQNEVLKQNLSAHEATVAAIAKEQAASEAALAEKIRQEKEAADAIKAQNAAAREQMALLKQMAGLWASVKIEKGLAGSLNADDEYNRTAARVRAMNMGGAAGVATTFAGADLLQQQNPNMTRADALKVYNAGQTGLQTSDGKTLNAIMPQIATTLTDLKYMFPEQAHNFENATRNIVGVFETMGITQDTKKQTEVLNNIYKAIVASGGKVNVEDIETIMRRGGLGNAANKSGDYMFDAIAVANAMKVMGGGGSGGGGVSTQGVMEQQVQKLISGGSRTTKQGLSNLVEFGFVDEQRLKEANPKGLNRNYNTVPWVNSQMAQSNIYDFMRWFGDSLRKQMSDPTNKNADRFFDKGADRTDEKAINTAIARFIDQSIGSKNAPEALKVFTNQHQVARINEERDNARNAASPQQTRNDIDQSYGMAVDKFSASITNLQQSIGQTLKDVAIPMLDWITKFAEAATNFAKDNPLATQFTAIAVAVGGAYLGFKSLTGMFGLVGSFTQILQAVTGAAVTNAGAVAAVGTATAETTAKTGLLNGAMGLLLNPIKGVTTAWTTMGENIVAKNAALMTANAGVVTMGGTFKMFGTVVGETAMFIGKSFMKMIPLVGWLLMAWDFGKLLMQVEVGGHAIGDWLMNWFDGIINWAEIKWKKFLSIFSTGQDAVKNAADIKLLEEQRKKQNADFDASEKQKNGKTKAENAADMGPPRPSNVSNFPAQPAAEDYRAGQGLPSWGGGGRQRGSEDPFIKSMAEMRSKATIDAMKVAAAITNDTDDLIAQAKTAFKEKWMAGDFDPGHDPKKRPFGDGKGGIDWNAVGGGGSTPTDWVKQYADLQRLQEQAKAMTFVKEREAAAETDLQAAMERTNGQVGKQSRDMAALERELSRAESRLKNGTAEWNAWAAEKNKALEMKSGAALVNFGADFADQDRKDQASLQSTNFDKIAAEYDRKAAKDKEQFQALLKANQDALDAELAALKAQLNAKEILQTDYDAKVKAATDRSYQAQAKASEAFTQHEQIQAQMRATALEGSVGKLAKEWGDTYNALDQMQAKWASSFVDTLSQALQTGKLDWRNFLKGMLVDILNAKLKETFAGSISGAMNGIGAALRKFLFPSANGGAAGAAGTIGAGASTAATAAGQANYLRSLTAMTAAQRLHTVAMTANTTGTTTNTAATATNTASTTVNTVSTDGNTVGTTVNTTATAGNTVSTGMNTISTGVNTTVTGENTLATVLSTAWERIKSLFSATTEVPTQTTAATTMASLVVATQAAATSLMQMAAQMQASSAASAVKFANGGIMSSMGSLPLHKYANGGVANTPQLALFGEGSMNEAYVPLPDGRSIPVTISATGSGSNDGGNIVSIQINVNKDGSSSMNSNSGDSTSADAAMWNKLAQKVKDVVKDELVTQKRPGGILAK